MEERCWKQFWETGKITDYLAYRDISDRNISVRSMDSGSEETIESDYSDRDGFTGITYR